MLPSWTGPAAPVLSPAALVLLVVAILATSCSSSDDEQATAPSSSTTTTAVTAGEPGFRVVRFDAVGPVGVIEDLGQVQTAVTDTLDSYLSVAVLEPLISAMPAGDLGGVLAPAAQEALTPESRAALVDENLPRASGIRVERAEAAIDALAGGDGAIALVVAEVSLVVVAEIGDTTLTVRRSGQISLEPLEGRWLVSAFDLAVNRDTPPGVTTTVAASPTPTGAG